MVHHQTRPSTTNSSATEIQQSVHVFAEGDDAKRARKRATDRKSQQHHRQRQKAYIKHLEDSVRTLKDHYASDPEGKLAGLIKANEKLEGQVAALLSVVQRVRGVVNEDLENTGLKIASVSASSEDKGRQESSALGVSVPENPDIQQPVALASSQECIALHTAPSPDIPQHELDFLDFLDPDVPNNDEDRSPQAGTSTSSTSLDDILVSPTDAQETWSSGLFSNAEQPLCNNNNNNSCNSRDIANLDLCLTDEDFSNQALMPLGFPKEKQGAQLLSLNLPRHSPPMGQGGRALQNMLTEAKMEHRCGRFNSSPPSLRRLLVDPCGDVLAFRLFHYIRGYGDMPMHHLLGIFWVQYLVLRWQVLMTEEAFSILPDFMRPTAVERQIPHSVLVDLFVWPDLRQALISQAADIHAEAVGCEIVKHLKHTWSPSMPAAGRSSGLVASLDVFRIIEQQALSWDFWSVGPGFVNKFPQFSTCHLGERVTSTV